MFMNKLIIDAALASIPGRTSNKVIRKVSFHDDSSSTKVN